jgi:hypothetical protein
MAYGKSRLTTVPLSTQLGGFYEIGPRGEAADLARKARLIADDVNHVCGQEACIGSLSLAVLLLAQAVEALAGETS